MRKIQSLVGAGLLVLVTPVFAGVEMDLITTDAQGAVTESVKLYAQSGKIRMQDIGDSSGQEMSMIFVGKEFIVVDHSDKSYVVMDEAMVEEMGVKVNAAMEQMRAQLADMPPEQRAMVEQMMQGEMAGATSKIFRQLHDSDLKFGNVTNEDGESVELSPSTFSQFLISPDREVRKTAFHQFGRYPVRPPGKSLKRQNPVFRYDQFLKPFLLKLIPEPWGAVDQKSLWLHQKLVKKFFSYVINAVTGQTRKKQSIKEH